jgi:hypothetical protein
VTKIGVIRLSEILRRTLYQEGQDGPRELGPEIHGVVALEVDRPEWKFLSNEFLASAPLFLAASPGNFTGVGLINPVNSGVLAVIERIVISNENAAATAFNLYYGGASLGATFRGHPRDQRYYAPQTTRSSCLVGSVTEAAASGFLAGRVGLPPGGSVILPWPLVIPSSNTPIPGQVVVKTAVINQILSVTYVWRERAIVQLEAAQ